MNKESNAHPEFLRLNLLERNITAERLWDKESVYCYSGSYSHMSVSPTPLSNIEITLDGLTEDKTTNF